MNNSSSPEETVENPEMKRQEEMKREVAKAQIQKYFYQLTVGCGKVNGSCKSKYCASNAENEKYTPNQAAIKAIFLYTKDEKLCDQNTKQPMDESGNEQMPNKPSLVRSVPDREPSISSRSNTKTSKKEQIPFLDEDKLNSLINQCDELKNYSLMIRTLGSVFSSIESIAKSFQKMANTPLGELLERVPCNLKTMKKEDMRALEGDLEKDEDCQADSEETRSNDPGYSSVDFEGLRKSIRRLYEKNSDVFGTSINNALQSLSITLAVDMRINSQKDRTEEIITVFVILFEVFAIGAPVLLEQTIPQICTVMNLLNVDAQARIVHIWSKHCKDILKITLETLQQIITLQVMSNSFYRDSLLVHNNDNITNVTKVMKILFWANILASELESPKLHEEPDDDERSVFFSFIAEEDDSFLDIQSADTKSKVKQLQVLIQDPLAIKLGVSLLDCRVPFIPFEEFYNEPLCDVIEMDTDYLHFRSHKSPDGHFASSLMGSEDRSKKFSFMLHSYILTPATKSMALFLDSRIRMFSERRISLISTHIGGNQTNPYLKLKVRRENLIDDALVELEMVAMTNPKDLKKQLVVEFIGEQGIDEGGVSKEFFQLIIEEILNPDYGMFIINEESQTVWFNSLSFENTSQFTLIGIVLGLAIYNNIILPLAFPMVVYRKLMDLKGSFSDLQEWNPTIYNSLKSILDYSESDMEDVFAQTFEIGYQDVFGSTIKHNLIENGDQVMVNMINKQEFVDLYTDYLLNKSIEKQFKAFKKGFRMVTDESPLSLLFRPEEIELLVCGSKSFDFNELEQATDYEGGYSATSEIIKNFWTIVHGLPIELKRKLLQFTTGSDRIPVGGLSKLKLVIARHGPDCDRLPTSHTCYNILLLPEYSSYEKLEERLVKAINYSKGFGML